ncbi:PQQ-binding-like beta-propeller repeat protein [Phycisphaerales bacterium ac7]
MRAPIAILALSTAVIPAFAQVPVELRKITASDAVFGDLFGSSVAISGTTAIVGAERSDDAGSNSGSAYIYDFLTGHERFKLIAADGAADDRFGASVAISGTTAIVGAQNDDDAGSNSGSAYVFDTTTGEQLFKLTASDADANDRFGCSVAISGTTAIVGAYQDGDAGPFSGSAYVFDTTTGAQLFKLTASDAEENDRFGFAVAISGTTAIVGAGWNSDAGIASGSAYIFDTTTGAQLFKLTASDAASGDFFGDSVGISGDTAIVGSALDDDAGEFSGSAYLFDTTTGEERFKLTATDASSGQSFGASLSVSSTTAIVGATDDSAYFFDITTGQQLHKLTASDAGGESSGFGSAVAISDTVAFVGARLDNEQGAAYAYSLFELTQQPQNTLVDAGESVSLSVSVADETNVGYQWRRNGEDLVDSGHISGAQTAMLQFIASIDDIGHYDCQVASPLGSATTNSILLAVRPTASPCVGDANGDGVVDLADLNAVLAAFGQACP